MLAPGDFAVRRCLLCQPGTAPLSPVRIRVFADGLAPVYLGTHVAEDTRRDENHLSGKGLADDSSLSTGAHCRRENGSGTAKTIDRASRREPTRNFGKDIFYPQQNSWSVGPNRPLVKSGHHVEVEFSRGAFLLSCGLAASFVRIPQSRAKL